jgi:hypothetical protein
MTEPIFKAIWAIGKAAAAKLCPQALAGMIAAERARRGIRQGARMARRIRPRRWTSILPLVRLVDTAKKGRARSARS